MRMIFFFSSPDNHELRMKDNTPLHFSIEERALGYQ